MKTARALSWIIALCGLWEFGDIVAPFVPGFGAIRPFVWNHIVVGAILMIAGGWAARTRNVGTARTMDCLAAVAGLWLIIASFVLGNPVLAAGLWNDVGVGAIVLVLGVWAALVAPRAFG